MNNSSIFVASPVQTTTGMVLDAPLGTPLPTDTKTDLNEVFKGSGYVSEDGVSVSPSWDTTELKDMSGSTVRTLLDGFTGEITFSLMNLLDTQSVKQAFGEGNVTVTPATTTEGQHLAIAIGAELPPAREWVFNMKDGDAKVRIVVPNGQITAIDSIEFNKSNSANLPVTLTCNSDNSGKSIYIYTDDGQKVGA